MLIKLEYAKHMRKDGTYNSVIFDTDTKQYSDSYEYPVSPHKTYTYIEAALSKDVDTMRETLIAEGYTHVA